MTKIQTACLAVVMFLAGAAKSHAQLSLEPLPDWEKRIRIGGNMAFEFSKGERDSRRTFPKGGFEVRQFQPTIDAQVADNISVLWEMDVVREAAFQSRTMTTALYARLDNLAGKDWLNLKVGRFAIPFGEEYELTIHPIDNPLASNTVMFPYGYDVGAQLFGGILDQKLNYVAAVMNGNSLVNNGDSLLSFNSEGQKSFAGKLWTKPVEWARWSVSILTTGKRGTQLAPGQTAFETGGIHFDGVTNEVTANAYGTDLILSPAGIGRLWLSGGIVDVHRPTPNLNSRRLSYYGIEAMRDITAKIYAAARWSSITSQVKSGIAETVEAENGWDGFSVRNVGRLSLGLGYRLAERAVVKLEYSVDSAGYLATPAGKARMNYFIAQLALRF